MACFIAPMSLAIVTTIFRKKIPESLKIGWLNVMIWGGVVMLAVEHIAHGTMTIAIVFIWLVMVAISQRKIQILKTTN